MSSADPQLSALSNRLLPRPRDIRLTGGELKVGRCSFALQLQGSWTAESHQQLVGLLRHFEGQAEADTEDDVPLRVFCGDADLAANFGTANSQANEGYELTIDAGGIRLSAATAVGINRGAQTLAQLLALQLPAIPCLHIVDEPELAWRAVLIDVARHFMPLPALLRTLDGMAHHKLNVLHLHLTDDQAFRFPSTAYPALNQFGSAYTLAELHTLVGHAKSLGIRVVPELDMPGHTTCWLAAYPEWSLQPVTATQRFGVHPACLNPADEQTYSVIATLLDEFAAVFPDPCVHVGGDEVHPRWWRENAGVQAFMRDHQFAEPADLQAYFSSRVAQLLTERGKQMLVWDEAVHAALPEGTVVQAWRGMTARDAALSRGHQCIVSAPYYLDLLYPADLHTRFAPGQSLADAIALEDAMLVDERLAHVAGGLEWTKQWRKQPIATDGARDSGVLLGAEACLWSELVDEELLDVRLWSRLPLLAELFWCGELPAEQQDDTRIIHSLLSWQFCGGPELASGLIGGVSRDQLDLLSPLGVSGELAELLAVLEPSKWYSRLLGATALAARLQGSEMPQARPYDMTSALRGVADVISPQSFRCAQFTQVLARWQSRPLSAGDLQQLEVWGSLWRAQAGALEKHAIAPELAAELGELAGRLSRFAGLVEGLVARAGTHRLSPETVADLPVADLRDWLQPVGELMLAVVAPLLVMALASRDTAESVS